MKTRRKWSEIFNVPREESKQTNTNTNAGQHFASYKSIFQNWRRNKDLPQKTNFETCLARNVKRSSLERRKMTYVRNSDPFLKKEECQRRTKWRWENRGSERSLSLESNTVALAPKIAFFPLDQRMESQGRAMFKRQKEIAHWIEECSVGVMLWRPREDRVTRWWNWKTVLDIAKRVRRMRSDKRPPDLVKKWLPVTVDSWRGLCL